MATRSNIAYQTPNGQVREVYCHFDGYRSHVGKMLFQCYNSEELANEVTRYGGISSLQHSIEDSNIYSIRDNEPIRFEMYSNFDEWCKNGRAQGHAYIFRNGCWWDASNGRLLKLTATNVNIG